MSTPPIVFENPQVPTTQGLPRVAHGDGTVSEPIIQFGYHVRARNLAMADTYGLKPCCDNWNDFMFMSMGQNILNTPKYSRYLTRRERMCIEQRIIKIGDTGVPVIEGPREDPPPPPPACQPSILLYVSLTEVEGNSVTYIRNDSNLTWVGLETGGQEFEGGPIDYGTIYEGVIPPGGFVSVEQGGAAVPGYGVIRVTASNGCVYVSESSVIEVGVPIQLILNLSV